MSKTDSKRKTLPSYIVRRYKQIRLDGYTWKELAAGWYEYGSLPCPECGGAQWANNKCREDGEPYPTLDRALQGASRTALVDLIRRLALGETQ